MNEAVSLLVSYLSRISSGLKEELPLKNEPVATSKVWTIYFSEEVEAVPNIESFIYVEDANSKRLEDVKLTVIGEKVLVEPPAEGYIQGASYTLNIDKFTIPNGRVLSNPTVKEFNIVR